MYVLYTAAVAVRMVGYNSFTWLVHTTAVEPAYVPVVRIHILVHIHLGRPVDFELLVHIDLLTAVSAINISLQITTVV